MAGITAADDQQEASPTDPCCSVDNNGSHESSEENLVNGHGKLCLILFWIVRSRIS